MRSIQSRWLENWRFKEFPPGRDKVQTNSSGHKLCFRHCVGRHYGEKPPGQSRGPFSRNVETDFWRRVCLNEELEVSERAHQGTI